MKEESKKEKKTKIEDLSRTQKKSFLGIAREHEDHDMATVCWSTMTAESNGIQFIIPTILRFSLFALSLMAHIGDG